MVKQPASPARGKEPASPARGPPGRAATREASEAHMMLREMRKSKLSQAAWAVVMTLPKNAKKLDIADVVDMMDLL